MSHHPLVEDAAEGRLPDWAVAGEDRRAHMTRVADLMGGWAAGMGLGSGDVVRWRAAANLHDALRDADPDALRSRVPPALQGLPGPLLHGPAAAERLRIDGVEDGPLLVAVANHTTGSPRLDLMGRALYAADFLEPGRTFRPEWREGLRDRMPGDLQGVVFQIVAARMEHQIGKGRPLLGPTVGFWNRLVEDRS